MLNVARMRTSEVIYAWVILYINNALNREYITYLIRIQVDKIEYGVPAHSIGVIAMTLIQNLVKFPLFLQLCIGCKSECSNDQLKMKFNSLSV